MRHFAEDPGASLCGAANHDGVGPGGGQHVTRLFGGGDVAIGHHRHTHSGLDGGDGVVFGLAFVTLLAGAAMDGQHLHPGLLKHARQRHRIFVRLAPAGAHLQRHGHVVRRGGGHHGLDDGQGQGLVLHQRRTCPLVAHLFGRAAHVDVDDLCTPVDVVAGSVGHHLGVGACNLHSDGAGLTVVVGAARGFEGVPQVAPRGHHLTHRITRAQRAAQLAKRPVGDTCHRRGEQVVRQRNMADVHGVRGGEKTGGAEK